MLKIVVRFIPGGFVAFLLFFVGMSCSSSAPLRPVSSLPPMRPAAMRPVTLDSAGTLAYLHEAVDHFIRVWRYHWEFSDRHRAAAGYDREPTNFVERAAVDTSNRYPSTMPPPAYATWGLPPGLDSIFLSRAESLTVVSSALGLVAAAPLPRNFLLHCHPSQSENNPYERVRAYIIESYVGERSVCPSWYPSDDLPWDERISMDESIVAPLKPRLRLARAELLSALGIGAARYPGDEWIAGQRLRFALDQRDSVESERAVNECRATEWWCTALRGYLLRARGNLLAADSAFTAMFAQMPEDMRCNWADIRILLDDDGYEAYRKLSCAERDVVNAKYWWLSDPLFSDEGNDRRGEHYARKVEWLLRSETGFHERWDMREEGGGRAVEEMIVRYGWPNYSYWGGRLQDVSHFGYLNHTGDSVMYVHGRFATAEYSAPRVHSSPVWSAVVSPLAARDYDWTISEAAHLSVYPTDTIFWPREHYDRKAGPLIQLWSQHGLFRRQNNVMMAMASTLFARDFGYIDGDTLWGKLYFATGNGITREEKQGGAVGRITVLRTIVPQSPQLVALELPGPARQGAWARTRFAIDPPPPLSQMRQGEFAISAPVFITATEPRDLPPNNPEAALSRMHGSPVFREPETLGLYWETYGIAARDSVELQIRLHKHEPPPGFLRRLGMAVGLAKPPGREVSIRWTEQERQPGMSVNTQPGNIPIQGRVFTISTADLQPGDYTIVMSVRRLGGTPVTASREFWIIR